MSKTRTRASLLTASLIAATVATLAHAALPSTVTVNGEEYSPRA